MHLAFGNRTRIPAGSIPSLESAKAPMEMFARSDVTHGHQRLRSNRREGTAASQNKLHIASQNKLHIASQTENKLRVASNQGDASKCPARD